MKDNIRKCIGCQGNFDKSQMFKIMQKFDTKEVLLSPTNKDFGRSVYICKNKDCVEKAFKKAKSSQVLKYSNIEELKTLLQTFLTK